MTAPVDIEQRARLVIDAFVALDECDIDSVSISTRVVGDDLWEVAICDFASGTQAFPPKGADPVRSAMLDAALAELGRRVIERSRRAMTAVETLRLHLCETTLPHDPGSRIEAILARPVESLGIDTVRVTKAFQELNVRTLRDLVQRSRRDFSGLARFGDQSLRCVEDALAKLGLSLGTKLVPAEVAQ